MRTILLLVAMFAALAASCMQLLGLDDYQDAGGSSAKAGGGGKGGNAGGMGGSFGGGFTVGGGTAGSTTEPCEPAEHFFRDDFLRGNADGWGPGPILPAGSMYTTTLDAAFLVQNGVGVVNTNNVVYQAAVTVLQEGDLEIGGLVRVPNIGPDAMVAGLRVRIAAIDKYYEFRLTNQTNGSLSLKLVYVDGAPMELRTLELGTSLPAEGYRVRAVLRGIDPVYYELYAWRATEPQANALFDVGNFPPIAGAPVAGSMGTFAGSDAGGAQTFIFDDLYACPAPAP